MNTISRRHLFQATCACRSLKPTAPFFTVGMVQHGCRDDDIPKILGLNMLRVAQENRSPTDEATSVAIFNLRSIREQGASGMRFDFMDGFRNEGGARSRAMSASYVYAFLAVAMLAAIGRGREPPGARTGEFDVRHKVIAELGGEHIAHAIYRRRPGGGSIVGWGRRIVEWPLDQPQLREAAPRQGEFRFYNGGGPPWT